MTNKYAEGYPGKRYYGGCEWVDVAETLALERLKQIFGADHANVQPHSGAQANMAVFMARLQPGDTVLGMSLAHGGHLTHGTKVSFSGKLYNAVAYGVRRDTELIDFDRGARAGARAPAQADRRRRQRVSAHDGVRAVPRDRRRGRRDVAGRFRARRRTGCDADLHPSPVPLADFVDVDHAQDAARSARRLRSLHREVGAAGRQDACSPASKAAR